MARPWNKEFIMERFGGYFALVVLLACPVVCSFGTSVRSVVETPFHADPCEPCPDDRSDHPADPCREQTCFCSPFVSHELKPRDATDVVGPLFATVAGWLHARTDEVLPRTNDTVFMVGFSRHEHCAVGHGLPLLI